MSRAVCKTALDWFDSGARLQPPLRTARRLLSAGGQDHHLPGAQRLHGPADGRYRAYEAWEAGSIPAGAAPVLARGSSGAPPKNARGGDGFPASPVIQTYVRLHTLSVSADAGGGRVICAGSTPPEDAKLTFQGDGALHKREPRAVRVCPSAPSEVGLKVGRLFREQDIR
jgi:hypothetical protein